MANSKVGVFMMGDQDVLEAEYDPTQNFITIKVKNPSPRTQYYYSEDRLVLAVATSTYLHSQYMPNKTHHIMDWEYRNRMGKVTGEEGNYIYYYKSCYFYDGDGEPIEKPNGKTFRVCMQTPENNNTYLRKEASMNEAGEIHAVFDLDASSGHLAVPNGALYARGLDNFVSTLYWNVGAGAKYKVYFRAQIGRYVSNAYEYTSKMSYVRYYKHGETQSIEYEVPELE